MMTIDERADKIALGFIVDHTKLTIDGPAYRALAASIKAMAQQVARDQRHACADAAMAIFSEFPTVGDGQYADSGRISQAVMNATIK